MVLAERSVTLAELADMDVEGLTPEEIEVAKLAGRVYLAFKELPQAHPPTSARSPSTSTRSAGSCSPGRRSAPTPSTGRSSRCVLVADALREAPRRARAR